MIDFLAQHLNFSFVVAAVTCALSVVVAFFVSLAVDGQVDDDEPYTVRQKLLTVGAWVGCVAMIAAVVAVEVAAYHRMEHRVVTQLRDTYAVTINSPGKLTDGHISAWRIDGRIRECRLQTITATDIALLCDGQELPRR